MPTDSCTLTFWYHMFGGDCGSLLVFLNSGDDVKLLFNETGDHQDRWLPGSAKLSSKYGFRVHIVGSRGTSYKGKISLFLPSPPSLSSSFLLLFSPLSSLLFSPPLSSPLLLSPLLSSPLLLLSPLLSSPLLLLLLSSPLLSSPLLSSPLLSSTLFTQLLVL